MAGNSMSNASYLPEFRSDFGCSGWDGHGQRYQTSTSCFLFVQQGKCSQNPSPLPTKATMCKSTCLQGVHSNTDIFANTTACPITNTSTTAVGKTDLQNRQVLTSAISNFCDKLSDTSSCTQGLKSELNMCGFYYFGDAMTYCTTDAGRLDPCCLLVMGMAAGVTSGTTSVLAAAIPASIVDPVRSLPYVASGIALSVMVFFSLAFIFCVKVRPWRRASTTAIEPPSSDVTPGPFGTYGTLRRTGTIAKGVDSDSKPFRAPQPKARNLIQSFRRSIMGQKPSRVDPGLPTTNPAKFNQNKQSMYSEAGLMPPRSPAPPMPAYNPQMQQNRSRMDGDRYPIVDAAADMGNGGGGGGGRRMRVVEPYTGQLADELSLQVGDIVSVEDEFDDGWASGRNEVTGDVGAFPISCLDSLESYSTYDGRTTRSVVTARGVSLYASQAQL
ncbi:hypothetical protein HKX48_007180 [Thoreauomyces humboldtii]|nr:hypothetical protein HKX48_007180 [Thoreauomyces humboldtii]